MRSLVLTNWDRYQHYRDRDPPWVKLYRDILTHESWVLGTDLSRCVQVASIVLAPRYSNKIPYHFDLLKAVMHLTCKQSEFDRAVEHLQRSEFLTIQDAANGAGLVEQSASNVLAKCSSETERDKETETDKSKNYVELKLDTGPVMRVFAHWKVLWKHPNAKLDPKRRRIIATALKAYSETDLRNAIEGYLNSSHHCGENERKAVYDDIGLFLRDAAHIDAGLNFRQGHRAPAKVDLIFRRQEEYQAYKAAVEQGLSFSTQSEWDSHYGHQTH